MRTIRWTVIVPSSSFAVVILFLYVQDPHMQEVPGLVIKSSNSSWDEEKFIEPSQSGADLCCWDLCVVIGLASGSAGGLTLTIAAFTLWKCRLQRRLYTVMSSLLSAKNKPSNEKEAELQKQIQKTQEELDACVALWTSLLDLKTGLGHQREELRLQLEEIEEEMEENRERVRLVEREISESEREKETVKTKGYLREKQSRINVQRKLEKRKVEVEKQQLNMEKLMQKTGGIMETVTERKRRVENHMELLKLHLEELQTSDDGEHLIRV